MRQNIKIFAILTFVIPIFTFACTNSESTKTVKNSNANSAQSVDKQTYKSIGVIKKVDAENGKITIDHEDIPGYMSPMEMNEFVKDKALLETIKIGDKVEFEIERTGEKIVITKLNKIGEVAVINGAELYQTNCSACHGEHGEGAKKGIPLISGHALHHSETEYIQQITNGENTKMPAFKDKLSAEQIAEIVKFVRNEIQQNVVREDSHKHTH